MCERKRISWIDNARGICVFCVLLAHSGKEHYLLHLFYSPWFLTLFFFISGYLYNPQSVKNDLIKIFRTLILPYFILSLIIFFIGFDNWNAFRSGNFDFLTKKMLNIFLGHHLWFIPCIIMVQLYFITLYHSFMKTNTIKVTTALFMFLTIYLFRNKVYYVAPWCCDIACYACSFFIIGNVCKSIKWKNIFDSPYSLIYDNLTSHLGSFVFLLSYMVTCYYVSTRLPVEFHFAYNYFDSPLCFVLLSLFGILTISIFSNSFDNAFFIKLGRNSLVVFAFNGKAYALCSAVVSKLYISNNYLYVLLLCILESVFLLIIANIINNYAPFIIGRR